MTITARTIPSKAQLYLEFRAKGKPLLRDQSLDSGWDFLYTYRNIFATPAGITRRPSQI